MPGGRPPSGPELVSRLDGDDEARERLRVVLETIAGRLTIKDACARLSMSEARFHQIRERALKAALDGLAPGAPGRPRNEPSAEGARVLELEQQVGELEEELVAAQTRTEIALAAPHLLRAELEGMAPLAAEAAEKAKDERQAQKKARVREERRRRRSLR